MLTVGIRYLNGFAAATDPDDRDRAEWPPHPGRVFMALAASHFETGADAAEHLALEWLEALEPPLMYVPDGQPRDVVTHFVPVNDKAGPSKAMLQSAPVARDRQPRTFARTWLDCDTVWIVWQKADPPVAIREALAALCAKVTRVGHASSLVQMWLATESQASPTPNWVPDDDRAVTRLRIVAPGVLAYLERCFNGSENETYASLLVAANEQSDKRAQKAARAHIKCTFGGEPPPRHRPQLSVFQGYAPPLPLEKASDSVSGTVLSPHILPLALERLDGPYRHLDLLNVSAVCQRWREALCSQCNGIGANIASILSGHATDGTPLGGPHLAFVPLAFVGHPHADGSLLGMGLALPRALTQGERGAVLAAIGRIRELKLGRLGSWRVVTITAQRPSLNLLPKTWTGYPQGATYWATVTPIAFDQHPKAKDKAAYQVEMSGMIRLACRRVDLPEPREVIVTPVSFHLGTPPAHAFPRLVRKDGSQRRHSHAIVVFEKPVHGPILLGAGRYRGYGLCRPMREET